MRRTRASGPRRTLCTHCDLALDISADAKSVSCPHCHQRVVTEALDVKDYVAVRRFHTANRMCITKKGIVYAAVRADELVVEGVLEGAALSMGGIKIGRKAKVKADLRGLRLSFEVGAEFQGDVRIGPDQVPELMNLAREAAVNDDPA